MSKTLIQELIDEVKDTLVDETVGQAFGGDFALPGEGKALARMVEYIEFGKFNPPDYQGQKKNPATEVRITFELYGMSKDKVPRVKDVDGKKIAERISIRLFKSTSENSGFVALAKKLKEIHGDSCDAVVKALGLPLIINVKHNKSSDGKKTYANINKGKDFWFSAPRVEDPETGEIKVVNVPEIIGDVRMFLFDKPTIKQWNSLYIPGTREVEVNGVKQQVSKNWLQEKVTKALNFSGSAVEELLVTNDSLPDLTLAHDVDEAEEVEELSDVEVKQEPAKEPVKATKTTKKGNKAVDADTLALLGM